MSDQLRDRQFACRANVETLKAIKTLASLGVGATVARREKISDADVIEELVVQRLAELEAAAQMADDYRRIGEVLSAPSPLPDMTEDEKAAYVDDLRKLTERAGDWAGRGWGITAPKN